MMNAFFTHAENVLVHPHHGGFQTDSEPAAAVEEKPGFSATS
jgi:hypothetical protein